MEAESEVQLDDLRGDIEESNDNFDGDFADKQDQKVG